MTISLPNRCIPLYEIRSTTCVVMKTPCPECAASSVWTSVAKVTSAHGALVMHSVVGTMQQEAAAKLGALLGGAAKSR